MSKKIVLLFLLSASSLAHAQTPAQERKPPYINRSLGITAQAILDGAKNPRWQRITRAVIEAQKLIPNPEEAFPYGEGSVLIVDPEQDFKASKKMVKEMKRGLAFGLPESETILTSVFPLYLNSHRLLAFAKDCPDDLVLTAVLSIVLAHELEHFRKVDEGSARRAEIAQFHHLRWRHMLFPHWRVQEVADRARILF